MTRSAAAGCALGQRRATIDDIARLAGVSKRTVTRDTNQSSSVNEGTRKRIQAVMSQWGYRPDPQARGLALGRANAIALVYENPNPHYILNIQQGLSEGLMGAGINLVLHPVEQGNPTFLIDLRAFVLRHKLPGVVLVPPLSDCAEVAALLRALGCGYVRMASVMLDDPQHMVVGHDRLGALAAGRHILDLGHRRIAVISGPANFRSAAERRGGLEDAMGERGLKLSVCYALRGAYTFESGQACADKLLRMTPRPTAIFAGNDEMAAGVLHTALRLGLDVPGDLTVVGFDDFEIASKVWPPLTTVHTPTREAAAAAVAKLTGGGGRGAGEGSLTAPWLVIRASSGPAPARPFDL